MTYCKNTIHRKDEEKKEFLGFQMDESLAEYWSYVLDCQLKRIEDDLEQIPRLMAIKSCDLRTFCRRWAEALDSTFIVSVSRHINENTVADDLTSVFKAIHRDSGINNIFIDVRSLSQENKNILAARLSGVIEMNNTMKHIVIIDLYTSQGFASTVKNIIA
jgi:hypothetical protein